MIPKIVHLTWKHHHLTGPLKKCVDSFRIWNPDWDIRFYSDEDCENFVNEYYPDYAETYFSFPPGIFRADIFRVLAVKALGGVYADIDVECRRPLDDLFEFVGEGDWDILLTRDHPIHERNFFKGRKVFMNDFFAAEPGSRFCELVLEEIKKRALELKDRPPQNAVFETGPLLFTEIVEQEILRSMQGEDAVKVRYVPWERIHPVPDMSNSFVEREEWATRILNREWADEYDPFVVHYWHHTWCRVGNTLDEYGDLLLQSTGEIAESRIQQCLPFLGEHADTVGMALCNFAESGEGDLIEIGTAKNILPVDKENDEKTSLKFWDDDNSTKWKWDANSFSRVASEVLQGLPSSYYHVNPFGNSKQESTAVSESLSGLNLTLPEKNSSTFLKEYEGQAGLIYLNHGKLDEKSAHLQESDAKLLIERNLIRPGGFVLIDNQQANEAAAAHVSQCTLRLFTKAGFEVVSEENQLLLRRPSKDDFPVPRIIHFFSDPEESSPSREVPAWRKIHKPHNWTYQYWTLGRLRDFVLESFPDFISTWDLYESDKQRVKASRYLVLKYFGGVAVSPHITPHESIDSILENRSLVFLGRSLVGRIPSTDDAVRDSFIASTPNHRFWDGITEALFHAVRTKDTATRTGSIFTTRRVRKCMGLVSMEDQPVILGDVCGILSVTDTQSQDLTKSSKSILQKVLTAFSRS